MGAGVSERYTVGELAQCVRFSAEYGDHDRICDILLSVSTRIKSAVFVDRDRNGRTAIHLAARHGHIKCIETLAAHGCGIDVQDVESGWSPLQIAVYFGHLSAVVCLLSLGADIYQVDNDGVSPLDAVTARVYLGVPSHAVPAALYDRHRESNTKRAYNRRRKTSVVLDVSDEDSDSDVEDEVEDGVGQAALLNNQHDVDRGDRSQIFGELHTWGSNATYTLGRPNTSKHNHNNPERISVRYEDDKLLDGGRLCNYTGEKLMESQVVQVATGKFHSACIDRLGNLFTWGYGSRYALGHGDDVTQLTPKQVTMTPRVKVIEICVADDHMVALSSERQVYTCGTNSHQQLGHPGLELDEVVPELRLVKSFKNMSYEEGVIAIAVGPMHTVCATLESVYTFGRNMGQLGHPPTINQRTSILTAPSAQSATVVADDFQLTPRIVSFLSRKTTVVRVAAGASLCTACLTKDGQVYVMAGYAVQCISIAPAPTPSVGGDCEGTAKFRFETTSRQRPTVMKVSVGVDNNAVALSNFHVVYMIYIYPALSPKTWRYTPVLCQGLGSKGPGRRIIDIAIGRATLLVTTQNGHVFKGNLPATPVYNAKRRLDMVEISFERILGLHRATSVSCSHRGDSFSAVCETSFQPSSDELKSAYAVLQSSNPPPPDMHSSGEFGAVNTSEDPGESKPLSGVSLMPNAGGTVAGAESATIAEGNSSDAIAGVTDDYIDEVRESTVLEQDSGITTEAADVAFYCVGRSGKPHPTPVLAHRRLLAKHSEFFRTLHLWDRLSTTRVVSLTPSAPIRRDVFAKAIERIYQHEGWSCTRAGSNHEASQNDSKNLSSDNDSAHDMDPHERALAPSSQHAEQLYYLMCVADEYGLRALQRECEAALCSPRYIDVRNVCDVYHGATLINAQRLTDYCIAFVQLHLDTLLSRSDVFYEAVIDDSVEGMLSDPWNMLVAHLRVSLTSSNASPPVVHAEDAPIWAPRRARVRTTSRSGKADSKVLSAALKNVASDPAPQGNPIPHERVDEITNHDVQNTKPDETGGEVAAVPKDSAVDIAPETHNGSDTHKGKTRWRPLDVFTSTNPTAAVDEPPSPIVPAVAANTAITNPWAQKQKGTQSNDTTPRESVSVAPVNSLREILSTESEGRRRKTSVDGTHPVHHGSKPLVEVKKMSQRERKKALQEAALKEAEVPVVSKVPPKPAWGIADVVADDDDTFLIDTLPKAVSLRDVQMEEEQSAAKRSAQSRRRSLNKIDKSKQVRKSGWDLTAAVAGPSASPSQPVPHLAEKHTEDHTSLMSIQQQQEDTRWKRAHTKTSLDCVIIEDRAIAELTAMYSSMGITVRVERVVDSTAPALERGLNGTSSRKIKAKATPWVKN